MPADEFLVSQFLATLTCHSEARRAFAFVGALLAAPIATPRILRPGVFLPGFRDTSASDPGSTPFQFLSVQRFQNRLPFARFTRAMYSPSLLPFYGKGHPGMISSISPISRMVSFSATTIFW
ncbi:MAG: hypothetical protein ACRD4H_07300 [Candidatus Acidiferrales bacterium]